MAVTGKVTELEGDVNNRVTKSNKWEILGKCDNGRVKFMLQLLYLIEYALAKFTTY